jgi:hypothetical protein
MAIGQMVRPQLGMEIAHQIGPAAGIAISQLRRKYSVGPKEPERIAQFAPARQDACVVCEGKLDRPDRSLRMVSLLAPVFDCKPLPLADGGPQQSERYRIVRKLLPMSGRLPMIAGAISW